jgi:hypothetical protein
MYTQVGPQGIQGEVGPAGATGDDAIVVQSEAPVNTDILWLDTDEPLDIPVPSGGTAGQVLTKASSADYDSTWSTPVETGLQLIKTQTIGTAVSSVTVNDAFSADYDDYKIMVSGGGGSTTGNLTLQLGSVTAANYRSALHHVTYSSGAAATVVSNNTTSFTEAGSFTSTTQALNLDILSPNLAVNKRISGFYTNATISGPISGFLNNQTAVTGFTIGTNTGTLTGGTIKVYGYRKA